MRPLWRCDGGIIARLRSQPIVIAVTAWLFAVWHKRCIMGVGPQSVILKASDAMQAGLVETGTKRYVHARNTLFCEDSENAGVFLVVKGRVRMSLRGNPSLDRLFVRGALLGLPSSFTGMPYSLTAIAITGADVVNVARTEFLRLMGERPDLCLEATEMLGREMTFIQAARRSVEGRSLSRRPLPVT
ncbi:MAG: Crp/Fnr family transcriptional regulator [Candidatus Korobacteraceae bacterium]